MRVLLQLMTTLVTCNLVLAAMQANSDTELYSTAKDPAALALATDAQNLVIHGKPFSQMECRITAKATYPANSLEVPITISLKGPALSRVEGSGSSEVINYRHSVFVKAGKTAKGRSSKNTIGAQAPQVPLLSLLADILDPNTTVEYRSAGSTQVVRAYFAPTTKKIVAKQFEAAAAHEFELLQGRITALRFKRFAENFPAHFQSVEIRYSDYRNVGGFELPFRQETVIDGKTESVLEIIAVDLAPTFGSLDFSVPVQEISSAK